MVLMCDAFFALLYSETIHLFAVNNGKTDDCNDDKRGTIQKKDNYIMRREKSLSRQIMQCVSVGKFVYFSKSLMASLINMSDPTKTIFML